MSHVPSGAQFPVGLHTAQRFVSEGENNNPLGSTLTKNKLELFFFFFPFIARD